MNSLNHRVAAVSASLVCSQQATSGVPSHAVGCFKMKAGCAMTLAPRAAGELRIAHGRVWVTFDIGANDVTAQAGDHFLDAGDLLRLLPGQNVVMQGYEKTANASVYFSWEPDAALSPAASSRPVQSARIDVRQPLNDLGLALHLAGNALGRLVQGLAAGLAGALVPHRRPVTCAAQPCLTIRN